jgi:iron complex outermembrane recepter protein
VPNTDINKWIFNAPFDTINGLGGVKRDVKAVYAEVIMPVVKGVEVNLSARHDEYSGFGSTDNPKVSLRLQPLDSLVLRGSYSTGFRVPTFNQLYNGITESPNTGAGQVDPFLCPSRVVNTTPGNPCNAITFNTLFGGKSSLRPETAKMYNLGFVWQPLAEFSATVDFWSIERENSIQSLSLATIMANNLLFQDNFIRDASGKIALIDTRWVNTGQAQTEGIEISLRGNTTALGGKVLAGLDGTYLTKKRSKVLANTDFGPSEIGVFTRSGDLGIRWKHTAFVSYAQGPVTATLSQRYAGGYAGYVPPGVANGTSKPAQWETRVRPYSIFNLMASYSGFKNLTLTAGVKNLLDTDPPFANSYDTNTGSGSSWEPRVADPRGRSFVVSAEYRFF